jgi:acetyl esterase/lipase
MKKSLLAFILLMAGTASAAQVPNFPDPKTLPTPAQKGGIPLISGCISTASEIWETRGGRDIAIRNVTCPTLTPYLPKKGTGNGVAVIVAPGGAFRLLAIKHEGEMVAQWLADHGFAAFVLKYRLVQTPAPQKEFNAAMGAFMQTAMTEKRLDATPEAVADGQAAVQMVRARATEWKIDPKKVGMVGFSAGAMTVLGTGLLADSAARPDFIAPIYPPMMERPVPADAPPMFLAIAMDDPLFASGKTLGLIDSWRAAKRPLEVHLYEKGGHGFGMTSRQAAPALWIEEFHAWMKDRDLFRGRNTK